MTAAWQRLLRFPRAHARSVDAVFALALFAAAFPGSRFSMPGVAVTQRWWPTVLLVGAACEIGRAHV